MAIDKKLFKALRAGGLGHAAAALLADDNSKYAIGQLGGYDSSNDYLNLSVLHTNVGYLLSTYMPLSAQTAYFDAPPVFPLAAGAALQCAFKGTLKGVNNVKPNGFFYFNLTKMADANGIPVAPVRTNVQVNRTAGVLGSLPGVTNGWTFTGASGVVTATQATAGFYAIDVSFTRALADV